MKVNKTEAQCIMRGYMAPRDDAVNLFAQLGEVTEGLERSILNNIEEQLNVKTEDLDRETEVKQNLRELRAVLAWLKSRRNRSLDRSRQAELKQRGLEWAQRNPDHCPECFCRPGKGDSEQGTDHEAYCSLH